MPKLTTEQVNFVFQPEVRSISSAIPALALANPHEGIVFDQNGVVHPDKGISLDMALDLINSGSDQVKRKLNDMVISQRGGDKREATGYLGQMRLRIPFTETYNRIGGNGFNAMMSHRGAALLLSDFNLPPHSLNLPFKLKDASAIESIRQLGFEPKFDPNNNKVRESLIYRRPIEGKTIVSSCDTIPPELPKPSFLHGQSVYTNDILSSDYLKQVKPENKIAFSPNSGFFKKFEAGDVQEQSLRDFAPSVSLIGMNLGEATKIAKQYGLQGDPVEGLMQLGFTRGFVTNGIEPTVYWEGSENGIVYPVIDKPTLSALAYDIWNLSEIAENETGCGDSFFGASLAGLDAGLTMQQSLQLGSTAAAAVYTSPDSNLGRANLNALNNWHTSYFSQFATMSENSLL